MEILKDEIKLVVKDLYKTYGNEDVLKRISFEVKKGEFLSVFASGVFCNSRGGLCGVGDRGRIPGGLAAGAL